MVADIPNAAYEHDVANATNEQLMNMGGRLSISTLHAEWKTKL